MIVRFDKSLRNNRSNETTTRLEDIEALHRKIDGPVQMVNQRLVVALQLIQAEFGLNLILDENCSEERINLNMVNPSALQLLEQIQVQTDLELRVVGDDDNPVILLECIEE